MDPPSRCSKELACHPSTTQLELEHYNYDPIPLLFLVSSWFSSVHYIQLGTIRCISLIEVNKASLRKTQNCVNVLTGA